VPAVLAGWTVTVVQQRAALRPGLSTGRAGALPAGNAGSDDAGSQSAPARISTHQATPGGGHRKPGGSQCVDGLARNLVHRSVSYLYYRLSSFEIVEAVGDGRLGIP
jgi:hypothetical protein